MEIYINHTEALAYDFRRTFNVSYKEIGETISYEETFYLLTGLVKDTGSRLYESITGAKSLSNEGYLLIAIQNSIIASIQTSKNDASKKKDFYINPPKPTKTNKPPRSKEEAEKIFKGVRKRSQ